MNQTKQIHDSFNKHSFNTRYFLSPPDNNGHPVTNYQVLERCDCGHIQMDGKPLAVPSMSWICERLRTLVDHEEHKRMEKMIQAIILDAFNSSIAPKLGDARATGFLDSLPKCEHRCQKRISSVAPFEYQLCKDCGAPVFKHDYNPYSVADLFIFNDDSGTEVIEPLRASFRQACLERGPAYVANYYMTRLAHKGE